MNNQKHVMNERIVTLEAKNKDGQQDESDSISFEHIIG